MRADKKKELANILFGSRYCWMKETGEFLADEFYGVADEIGFLDRVESVVDEAEKKAFKAGFLDGAIEAVKDEPSLALDKTVNQITAERKYLKWRG
jgi:hypothetical protein